jgi:hypothetical protein
MKWSEPDVEAVISDLGNETERPYEPANGPSNDYTGRSHPDNGDETDHPQQHPEQPLPKGLYFAEDGLVRHTQIYGGETEKLSNFSTRSRRALSEDMLSIEIRTVRPTRSPGSAGAG